jgi:uncharacterized repeat protein (TIGR03803 family)
MSQMKPQKFSRTFSGSLTVFAVMIVFASASFAVTPKETVLHRFKGGSDGAYPEASLIEDSAHNLYGTTASGGTSHLGTVFEVSPPGTAWTETVLYSFAGGNDGAYPYSDLIFDKAGNLYGTTLLGGGPSCYGDLGCGTVFQLAPPATQGAPWTETVLYRFTGGSDGGGPFAGLIMDSKGNLYGTTFEGGAFVCRKTRCGTVFELSPPITQGGPWTEVVLYSFGKGSDGTHPVGNLAFGLRGAIFGTTSTGRSKAKYGTVFKLRPPATQGGPWTEEVLYRFTDLSDGGFPSAGLVTDKSGNLYGTTSAGGPSGDGVVFEISFGTWAETVLYSFTFGSDGGYPLARLLIDKTGNLYGTTTFGGINYNGSAFELSPPTVQGGPWTETTLYDFAGGHDGSNPNAGLTFGEGGQLYGTTLHGDTLDEGTVFRIIH